MTKKSRTYAACRGFFLYSTVKHPGNHIVSCAPGTANTYGVKSGTSMSTPLVSGAIALMLEKDPLLTNVEIKMLLRESTDDMGLPRNRQGWGKFNFHKFMSL